MRSETEASIRAVSLAQQIADSRAGAGKVTSKGSIDHVKPTVLARGAMVGLIQIARGAQKVNNVWERYYTGNDAGDRTDFYGDWFVDNGGSDTPVFKLIQDDMSIKVEDCRSPNDLNKPGIYESSTSITNAKMADEPKRTWTANREIQHQFETVAMALTAGANANVCPKGKVLGSITWGYKVSTADAVTLDAIRVQAGPTFTWTETRSKWNAAHRVKIPTHL